MGWSLRPKRRTLQKINGLVEKIKISCTFYTLSRRAKLDLEEEQKFMLISDVFKAQCTQLVFGLIDENNCLTMFVPANLTHVFHPLDLATNSVTKSFLKGKFSEWYSKEIAKTLDKWQDIHKVKVDTTLTVMKPIHAHWIIAPYNHLRNNVELTKKSFKEVGITSAIEEEIEPADTLKNLD